MLNQTLNHQNKEATTFFGKQRCHFLYDLALSIYDLFGAMKDPLRGK